MSIQSAPFDHAAPAQPWLRYRGKVAVIEASGIVDRRVESPLLVLSASAASRGSATVVLKLSRAQLDEGPILILARVKERRAESDVCFALAGASRDARDLLARAEAELELVMYPSVTAPAPWSSAMGNALSRRER